MCAFSVATVLIEDLGSDLRTRTLYECFKCKDSWQALLPNVFARFWSLKKWRGSVGILPCFWAAQHELMEIARATAKIYTLSGVFYSILCFLALSYFLLLVLNLTLKGYRIFKFHGILPTLCCLQDHRNYAVIIAGPVWVLDQHHSPKSAAKH